MLSRYSSLGKVADRTTSRLLFNSLVCLKESIHTQSTELDSLWSPSGSVGAERNICGPRSFLAGPGRKARFS